MSQGSVATFSRDSTRTLLRAACGSVGLDESNAQLLRLGQNAIYRLSSAPVVVRIARGPGYWSDAVKEVAVADWLASSGVPAVPTWPVEQPVDVEGHPVTFWSYVDGRTGCPDDVRTLGEMLRLIHALPRPTTFDLPGQEPLSRVADRIKRADLSFDTRSFLLDLASELTSAIAELRYPLAEAVNHGDAHVQNLMITDDGPRILDFESACWGHPEWDLITTATEFVTAGFWTAPQYKDFVDSYGFDITDWSGFDVMRRARELTMTTWLMQNVNESPEIRVEFEKRLGTLKARKPTGPWQAF